MLRDHSMNCRKHSRSPIPKSSSLRRAKSGARMPAMRSLGDKTIREMTNDEWSMTKRCRNPNAGCGGFRFLVRAWPLIRHSCSPDVPVFDQMIGDFLQKSRGSLKHFTVAGVESHVWVGEIQLIFGPSDCDVKKT